LCAPISIAPAPKKVGEDQAIGRSRGGLSTKIHALVDALGNPIGFFLTGGEAHDLVGADHLLPAMAADTLIADKAFDADERVLEPLAAAGKTAVIPPRSNRSSPRDYDRQLYAARHLIENFFAKIKQFRAIALRGAKVWAAAHFSLAPIRHRGFLASCAAAIRPFRAEPSRA
jgi:transposase